MSTLSSAQADPDNINTHTARKATIPTRIDNFIILTPPYRKYAAKVGKNAVSAETAKLPPHSCLILWFTFWENAAPRTGTKELKKEEKTSFEERTKE
jgi:hypothetical protein